MTISRYGFFKTAAIAVVAGLATASGAFANLTGASSVYLTASQAPQTATSRPVAQQAAPPCAGLPPGKHLLLEKMTTDLGLTCEQQLKVEPLLHSEESVSKPLLRFPAFSREEKQAVMLKIKLAARRQIRPLLTADQQKKMDEDITALSTRGRKPPNSKTKSGAKKAEVRVDLFESQESLSQAILNYSALSSEERKALVLQVKKAAIQNTELPLTPDQQKKIDEDIRRLSGN
jgi:hypothetical protein